jgi:excinuclease UvrABC ATPase subunit
MAPEIICALTGDYSLINQLEIKNFPETIRFTGKSFDVDHVLFTTMHNAFGRVIGWNAYVYDSVTREVPCENCNGSGYVNISVHGNKRSYELDDVECPDCAGSGEQSEDFEKLLVSEMDIVLNYQAHYLLDLTGEILEQVGEITINTDVLGEGSRSC